MPDWHRIRNQLCSNESTNQLCNLEFLLELSGACGLRPPGRPFGGSFPQCDRVKHVLAELLVSYEPVVDTQIELFALLLERIGDVVLAVSWLLP